MHTCRSVGALYVFVWISKVSGAHFKEAARSAQRAVVPRRSLSVAVYRHAAAVLRDARARETIGSSRDLRVAAAAAAAADAESLAVPAASDAARAEHSTEAAAMTVAVSDTDAQVVARMTVVEPAPKPAAGDDAASVASSGVGQGRRAAAPRALHFGDAVKERRAPVKMPISACKLSTSWSPLEGIRPGMECARPSASA